MKYDNTEMNEMRSRKLRNANMMLVRFDSYEERVASGELQTLYYKHPFEFRSLDQLLLIIDDVLDSVGFEKEQGDFHYLYGTYKEKPQVFQYLDPKDIYMDGEINSKDYENAFRGELTIHVFYRQNSSMQGEIRAGERAARFRSSLELLRMLYEFVEQRHEEMVRKKQ